MDFLWQNVMNYLTAINPLKWYFRTNLTKQKILLFFNFDDLSSLNNLLVKFSEKKCLIWFF